MYQVLIDGQVLYDPTLKDYKIFNPRVQLEVNKVGRFDFSIYPSHPRYNSILKLRSHIEVYQNGELIFSGRPLDDDVDFNKCKTVLCESDLAYLNDSIMRPYDFQGGVSDFLAVIINNHNSQVDASKQFTLGTVHAFGDFVRSNSEYTNTWEELSTKTFGSSMGGYLQLRRENDINYIDYLSDSLYISGQTIELSKNLLDYEKTVKASDIVTVLIPLGAKLKDEEGNELDDRLTIESVNAGSKFVEHTNGISKYGRIVGYKIWDDINSPSLLKTRATNDLNFLVNLGISIKIKAIDLNILDKSIPKIRFFQYVKIISKPHEIDDSMLIKKQTIHLDDPSQNTIEVGVEVSSFTDKQLEANNTIKIIKSDYVTNEKMTNVITPITFQISEIIQESDRIKISVEELQQEMGRVETETTENTAQISLNSQGIQQEVLERTTQGELLLEQTSSLVQQTAEDLSVIFSKLEADQDLTNGEIELIQSYFRINENGVIIGKSNSAIEFFAENNRVGFRENGNDIAYWEEGTMHVDRLIAVTTIMVGYHLIEKYDSPVAGNTTIVRISD